MTKICFGSNEKCPIFQDHVNTPYLMEYPCDVCADWISYQTNHLDDVEDVYTEPLYHWFDDIEDFGAELDFPGVF